MMIQELWHPTVYADSYARFEIKQESALPFHKANPGMGEKTQDELYFTESTLLTMSRTKQGEGGDSRIRAECCFTVKRDSL
jgi:hypothetical protein